MLKKAALRLCKSNCESFSIQNIHRVKKRHAARKREREDKRESDWEWALVIAIEKKKTLKSLHTWSNNNHGFKYFNSATRIYVVHHSVWRFRISFHTIEFFFSVTLLLFPSFLSLDLTWSLAYIYFLYLFSLSITTIDPYLKTSSFLYVCAQCL